MKWLVKLSAVLALLASASAYADGPWTYVLSQAGRNARIVSQAQTQIGVLAGECKSFAVDVVRVASNQANNYTSYRLLPLTASYSVPGDMSNYYWEYSQFVTAIQGNGAATLRNAVPGSIIQMRMQLKSGGFTPHTTIVETNDTASQTLGLIESNYAGDGRVRRRSVAYVTFASLLQQPTYYTIYQIQ